ncbi:MAG: hypothetical protein QNJ32_03555 [Xenococcaceae cyanobacterium MO_167.B27]|nr:hypothetical protein [Xenococcaceae cyanobacterium MO_167.B27]
MRRTVLFLSGFLLSLWIVLFSAFLSLLFSNAPYQPDHTPFESVYINAGSNSTVYLPNPIFDCIERGQQFECQTEIQDRLLDLSFTKHSEYQSQLSNNCRAWYDGRSIGCQEKGANIIGSQFYEITDLELSPQQLWAVQKEYWGITFLMELGERGLFKINDWLSLMVGICVALLAWFHPNQLSKAFAIFVCGLGVFRLVDRLLIVVNYQVLKPYYCLIYFGCTPGLWEWFLTGTVLTALTTAFLLWSDTNQFVKTLLCLVSGLTAITLIRLVFLYILLDLGYAD